MPACVCRRGQGAEVRDRAGDRGWEIQKTEQGATQWGRHETREQRQGSLRQMRKIESRRDQRPQAQGKTGREQGDGSGGKALVCASVST